MKYLYLWESNSWKKFDYFNIKSLNDELSKRKIILASNVNIGNGVKLGWGSFIGYDCNIEENVTIGNYVMLKENNYVGKNTEIHSYSILHTNSKVMENCVIGENVHIDYNTVIENDCTIKDHVIIGKHKKVNSGTYIENSLHITTKKDFFNWTDEHIRVGCQYSTIDEIEKTLYKAGQDNGYEHDEIMIYYDMINLCKKIKEKWGKT